MSEEKKLTKLETLLEMNVNHLTEKKGQFTYLSWANAWKEFIKIYPEATYTVHKNEQEIPCFGNAEMGYMTYTSVTANGLTHQMWLPVLNFKNKPILKPNMFDVNTSVMRCLVKCLAMFGLGIYIYAGEDLPVEPEKKPSKKELTPEMPDMWKNAIISVKETNGFEAIEKRAFISDKNKELLREAADVF